MSETLCTETPVHRSGQPTRPDRPGWPAGLHSAAAGRSRWPRWRVHRRARRRRRVDRAAHVARHLGASLSQLEWTINAYNLVFACLMLTGAALGDRFGRRRMFVARPAACSRCGSALAALSTDAGALIVARVVQGAGAALVLPLTLTLISDAFPVEKRGTAIGIWGGIAGLAVAAGPVVGGAIIAGHRLALDLLDQRPGRRWPLVPLCRQRLTREPRPTAAARRRRPGAGRRPALLGADLGAGAGPIGRLGQRRGHRRAARPARRWSAAFFVWERRAASRCCRWAVPRPRFRHR